jgi:3-dehydroquinate dehydratase / shikimate dehydrogenase
MEQALADLESARPLADLFELRMDLIEGADLSKLLATASAPCIVTNRTKLEGGQFSGDEASRVAVLREAISAGADYVDIEVSTPREFLQPLLEGDRGKSQLILSYHDFSKTPDRVEAFYEVMSELPGDNIIKIVTYAQDINDNLQIFKLLRRAKQEGRKMIGLCMGEKGEISRILSPLLGGYLTFGSLERGKESAPGQITARRLKEVYRLDRHSAETKWYGVLGNPVSKSMGPWIHNRAFLEMDWPGIYLPFYADNAEKFFKAFESEIEGLSITMPFKEDVARLAGTVEDAAKKIGAVNTLAKANDGWFGANTDGIGAVKALAEKTSLPGKKILIIGAGGTAKAIGHEVVALGAQVTVSYHTNRERADLLAKELGGRSIPVSKAVKESCDILINCSPVGMNPNVDATPIPQSFFKTGMVVFDSVYNPLETRLLKEAREAGCTVIPGIELFLNQAGAQFELWTGLPAPLVAMREALLEQLGK